MLEIKSVKLILNFKFVRDYCKKENIRLLEIPYTEKV
jgi:hypothetical protein